MRLVLELLRPYRGWLLIVFVAMLVQTAMSIAAPWPLKIIIDNVVGNHKLPEFLAWLRDLFASAATSWRWPAWRPSARCSSPCSARSRATSTITTPRASAQYVANDLRSASTTISTAFRSRYYDTHQIGNMLSTITADVGTIQSFASTAMLSILVDLLTIIGMLGVMFYLNFDFALIAVGVTPFLLLFVARFKKAVKKATHEVRKRQSDIVAVVQQGLESVRSVKAFGRQDTGGSATSARRARRPSRRRSKPGASSRCSRPSSR